MNELIIFTIIGIIISLVAGFFIGRSYQQKQCHTCRTHDLKNELTGTINKVTWLVDELSVVKNLRFEEAARKDLMEFIHDCFFFREYKEPKDVYTRLENRRDSLRAMLVFKEENEAIAKVYQEVLDGISDSWLEDNK